MNRETMNAGKKKQHLNSFTTTSENTVLDFLYLYYWNPIVDFMNHFF